MAEVRFIEQGHEILGYWGDDPYGVEDTPVGFIASVARTCYKSKPNAWALLVAVAMARAVRKIARDGEDG